MARQETTAFERRPPLDSATVARSWLAMINAPGASVLTI